MEVILVNIEALYMMEDEAAKAAGPSHKIVRLIRGIINQVIAGGNITIADANKTVASLRTQAFAEVIF